MLTKGWPNETQTNVSEHIGVIYFVLYLERVKNKLVAYLLQV